MIPRRQSSRIRCYMFKPGLRPDLLRQRGYLAFFYADYYGTLQRQGNDGANNEIWLDPPLLIDKFLAYQQLRITVTSDYLTTPATRGPLSRQGQPRRMRAATAGMMAQMDGSGQAQQRS